MKDVRNKQLRAKLDKLGIKDIVLNFSDGTCLVWSEDESTDVILHYAMSNIVYANSFNQLTVDEWIDEISKIFDEGLDSYERSKEIQRNSNGHIIIGKQFKEKDTIHDVNSSKVYDVVTSWMKTHPKDMEILE